MYHGNKILSSIITTIIIELNTFSSFLSPFSNEVTASFKALTTSAGDFVDFPNKGILDVSFPYRVHQFPGNKEV